MKHKPLYLILLLVVTLGASLAHGQGSLGAIPKKARTPEDYQPTTLKEIARSKPKRDELLPFRVRVAYTDSVRPISTTGNDVLHRWAQCCAGNPDHYTKAYLNEMQFVERGSAYWLAVQDRMLADLQTELKVGEAIDLFLIRVSTRGTNGKNGSVLLLESFQKPGSDEGQTKESVDWIRNNLASYAEKDLEVEVPGTCRLKISDSSKNAGVSKAVVYLTLSDLDPTKLSLSRRPRNVAWDLWLHTNASTRSIRFMLYQGGPAEGGQDSKYMMSFPDYKKAEAMAEGFRRAINSCSLLRAPR
jgi:hypothetical protein